MLKRAWRRVKLIYFTEKSYSCFMLVHFYVFLVTSIVPLLQSELWSRGTNLADRHEAIIYRKSTRCWCWLHRSQSGDDAFEAINSVDFKQWMRSQCNASPIYRSKTLSRESGQIVKVSLSLHSWISFPVGPDGRISCKKKVARTFSVGMSCCVGSAINFH